jgi:hypothetical protein
MMKIAGSESGSGSISHRLGSADLDPKCHGSATLIKIIWCFFSVQDLEERLEKARGDLNGLELKVLQGEEALSALAIQLTAKQKEREKKEAKYSELT